MNEKENLPNHVVIIPDGNRRWAASKNLLAWDGHDAGAKNTEKIVEKAHALGIKNLSFWGSSLSNLQKRPLKEKRELLRIYEKYFKKLVESKEIHNEEAKINVIGKWKEQFPGPLLTTLNECVKATAKYDKRTLNFFLAYSGDDEMIDAVRAIAANYGNNPSLITSDIIKENLMTKNLPPVDLLIRTGGEPHLSVGFLMWDIANTQLYFSEKHYPDFKAEDFAVAITEYQRRERRHGK